ncbi:MAG TPA: hypothetical protein DDW55_07915 [Gammaproteobacteria bacterium]|nr:hypothetical protein [Gammaproteobacteria bacterium]
MISYRRYIDGLRALAVVPVVLHHGDLNLFSGGFVGVDVFFVISGFLIASIIRKDIRLGVFTVSGFYERRCRRILPALITVILASFVVGYFVMLPGQYADFGSSTLATLLFVSNFFFWQQTGYFAPVADWLPLLHTWSLAVEEQYYIIFPVFMLLARRWLAIWQMAAIGAVFLVSLLLSVYAAHNAPSAAFYLTPFRVWELLLGVLIAYMKFPELRNRWTRELVLLTGLLMLVVPIVTYDTGTIFPGFAALVPCLGAAVIIAMGNTGPSITRYILENRVLVFIGLISYSLYLWHWPIFVFLRLWFAQTHLAGELVTTGIVLSFGVATLSWMFIEKPFRRKRAFTKLKIFQYSAISVFASASIAGAIYITGGLPDRITPEALAIVASSNDIDPYRDKCAGRIQSPSCTFGDDAPNPITFVLWGDSHAGAFRPALETAMSGSGRKGRLIWRGGCAPLLGVENVADIKNSEQCNVFRIRVLKLLTDPANKIETVFLSSRWLVTATGITPEIGSSYIDLIRDDESKHLGPEENKRVFVRSLARTIDSLRAANKKVVLVGDVPEVGWSVPHILALSAQHGANAPESISRHEAALKYQFIDNVFREFASQDGVEFLPVWDLLCQDNCLITAENHALYSDDDHLSYYGAKYFLGPLMKEQMQAVGISGQNQ